MEWIMAKVIWKYPIPIADQFALNLPSHCKVLSFQFQKNTPCIWVLVDPDAPKVNKGFRIYGTGNPMGYFGNYIGTAQEFEGALVWHLFED
jgi:hypothetical protein